MMSDSLIKWRQQRSHTIVLHKTINEFIYKQKKKLVNLFKTLKEN